MPVDQNKKALKYMAAAALAGTAVAFMWMYLAAAAMTGGISFPASWNWAAYISAPTIKLFGLRFWPVTVGNGAFYAMGAWIFCLLSGHFRKSAAE